MAADHRRWPLSPSNDLSYYIGKRLMATESHIMASLLRYGQGYKLDMRLDARARPEAILELLQQRIEGIKSDELEPPSMVLTVPQGSATLSRLFALLSELRSTHHVLECSVTQCTLEQIFIQMASKSKLRKDDE
jgi:hypothetical protein